MEISTFIITLSVIGKCRHRPTHSLSQYGFESVMKSLHRSRLSNTCRQWTRTLIGQCLPFNRFRHTFKVLTLNLLSFYLQKMKRDLLNQKHTIGFYRKVSANTVEVKIMIDEFKSALINFNCLVQYLVMNKVISCLTISVLNLLLNVKLFRRLLFQTKE